MRRPFCLLGFGMLAGIFLALYLPEKLVLLPMAISILLFFFALIAKKDRWRRLFPFFGASFLGICYLFLTLHGGSFALRNQVPDKPVPVSCTIVGTLPSSGSSNGYRAEIETLSGRSLSGYRQIALYAEDVLPLFEQMDADVIFFPSESLFDQLNRTDGCCVSAYLTRKESESITTRPVSKPFFLARLAERSRSSVKRALRRAVGSPYDGILLGAVTGNTEKIHPTDLVAFRQAGIAHLFAVSGLHLSILAGSFLILLKKLRLPPSVCALLTLPLIVCVVLLAGFSPSVLRAAVMLATALIALLLNKPYDPLNALGFTVFVLLLARPVFAADAGFLLSLSASGGILLLAGPINHRLKRSCKPRTFFGKALLSAFSVSTAAFLAVLPASCFFFDGLSLIAPLTNLPSGMLAPFLVFSGHVTALLELCSAPAPLVQAAAFAARFFAFLLRQTGFFFASLPAGLYIENSRILQILILIFAVLFLFVLAFRPSAKRAAALLTASALTLSLCIFCTQTVNENRDTILLQCTDQGVQILAVSRHKAALLATSSAGNMRMPVQSVLHNRCIGSFQYMGATRPTSKTVAALSSLSLQFPVACLLSDGEVAIPCAKRLPLTDSKIELSDRCSIYLSDRGGVCAFALHTQKHALLLLPTDADWEHLKKEPGFQGAFDFCILMESGKASLPKVNCKNVWLWNPKERNTNLPDFAHSMKKGQFLFDFVGGNMYLTACETEPLSDIK